ncbi:synaptonemal complex central element 2 isoform X2 [Brachionus plicatilis]|uniref:Synaptonemal complex central element 2 isoform X2 n=1 Tax=Brachionus plicatilis TaxID=10195 RepID=A0A3M7QZD5_BRAPC|nr:synaptonemal complex central element 2 isoform X2 [Brachionus plicatilis]
MVDNQDLTKNITNFLNNKFPELPKSCTDSITSINTDLNENFVSKESSNFGQARNLPPPSLSSYNSEPPGSELKSKFENVNSAQFSEALSEIIQRLNKKREKDQNIHEQFQECFNDQLNQFQTKVLEIMRVKYEDYSKAAQKKLEDIFDSLNRIKKLEQEIKIISNEVEQLHKIFNQ